MKPTFILGLLMVLSKNCENVKAAKILGVFHIPSPSHVILAQPLFKALAKRGHNLTVITSFPLNIRLDNYREIYLKEVNEFKAQYMGSLWSSNQTRLGKMISMMKISAFSEVVLASEQLQKLKSEHFDLIILNLIFSDALLGLGHHFKAPVIGFSPVGSNILTNQYMGNPNPLSYVPIMGRALPTNGLNFRNRVNNLVGALLSLVLTQFQNYYTNKVYFAHFPDGPSLDDLKTNVALVFVNSHYSIESPRPYVPNMIPIGGIHIEETKKLPRDLQEYLDSAKDGAIFFSFGSNFKLLTLGEGRVKAIIDTLGNSKMKVLFKSDEELNEIPSNIKIAKWLPQNDILAHPNVKLFISHGGLLSTTEAVYHGVPILGIPLFADQEQNVMVSVADGYAVQVNPDELTKESFSKALDEILNNPKYHENIDMRSNLLREQPIKPLDLALFWVEHVLKHRGAVHLKNVGATLPWYQYHLFDAMAFLTVVSILSISVGFLILKRIISIFCKSTKRKEKIPKPKSQKKSQ